MVKLLSEKSLTNSQIFLFIVFIVFINFLGLLSPILSSNDSNFYSIIAKNIIINHDWINLTFQHNGWLDKPHFPFWMIAISYKIFGISVFSYILPGFIFNIIGGVYTYLLGRKLFSSREVGLLSALIYFSSIHLMISSIDVRQEAYLLGELMPACYYWYLYNEGAGIKLIYLLLGAFFTALALMTKGIFLLLLVFSGLATLWIVNGQWKNFIRLKWILAVVLSLIFIAPELICLYLQFDLHPEMQVAAHGGDHISGIKWFFWGSQFGRFFDTGAITSGKHDTIGHYFYFIHTFMWAFLPWSIVFLYAIVNFINTGRTNKDVPTSVDARKRKANLIYLFGSFLPTFILFSLTKFQLDHYTNILIPFASIICANFLFNYMTRFKSNYLFMIQIGLSYLLCAVVVMLSLLIFSGKPFIIMLVCAIITTSLFVLLKNNYPLTRAMIYPVFAVALVFSFVEMINGYIYSNYDLGYNIRKILPNVTSNDLFLDDGVFSLSSEFFNKFKYQRLQYNDNELAEYKPPYYLIIDQKNQQFLDPYKQKLQFQLLAKIPYIMQDRLILVLLNKNRRDHETRMVLLYHVTVNKQGNTK